MSEGFDYAALRAAHRLEIPEYFNFAFDVLSKRAFEADKLAIIAVDRSGDETERLTYSDLDRASDRFANVLLGLGVDRGDFALVVLPRIPAWYHVLFGCMKVGAVAMPGTPQLTAKDMAYRINRAGARIAVVTEDGAEKLDTVRDQCPTLEHLIVVGGERPGWMNFDDVCAQVPDAMDRANLPPTRAEDLMLIYFTSGTTAQPKMVGRSHGYGMAHWMTAHYWQDLREDDIHWTLTDTGWAKAAWGMFFGQFMHGVTLLLFNGVGFDADLHLKLIEKYKVTTFCAPPTIYRLFASMDLSGYDLSSLRHAMGAGEPLNPEAMRAWTAATGLEVHDGYGQTETVVICANMPGMEIRPGSMGRPVPGITLDIVDDDGNILPDDTVGNIAIKITDPWPPGLFTGYYEDEEATARSFHDGWYFTGDTATRDADGYIWFVGRADDVISSASYRISPFEVESALIEHDAVLESAVVAKPDPLRGEIVKAYVVLAEGITGTDQLKQEIQDFVKQQTAPYKYPREIDFVEALPKTISGKIRRVELRDQAREEAKAEQAGT